MADNWMDKSVAEVESLTPATGFNVVAVDAFAEPGEALYLVKHCEDKVEADALASAYTKETGDVAYVYAPKD